jgi:hypothetical protein
LRPQLGPKTIDHDIIVLSSDDEEALPRKPTLKKATKPKPRAKSKPVAPAEDVVEVSSEEDPPQRATILELQKQLDRAKFVCGNLRYSILILTAFNVGD